MADEIYAELKSSYKNQVHTYCDSESLQYICFRQWIKNAKLTKTSVQCMCIPPGIKQIIRNYNDILVCDFCQQLTWNFSDRINHIRETHMEDIYAIISGLGDQ